jgi:hypothetical protein
MLDRYCVGSWHHGLQYTADLRLLKWGASCHAVRRSLTFLAAGRSDSEDPLIQANGSNGYSGSRKSPENKAFPTTQAESVRPKPGVVAAKSAFSRQSA